MKTIDIITRGLKNLRRNKSRTTLTVLAIGIGALTLILTLGVGNALENYINNNVNISTGLLQISKIAPSNSDDNGIETVSEYNPDSLPTTLVRQGPEISEVEASTQDDITAIQSINGIEKVWPSYKISPEYIRIANQETKYTLSSINVFNYNQSDLSAGQYPDSWTNDDSILDYIFASTVEMDPSQLVGQSVVVGIKDSKGEIVETTYTVSAVKDVPPRFGPPRTTNQGSVTIGIDSASSLYEIQFKDMPTAGQFSAIYAKIDYNADEDTVIASIEALNDKYSIAGTSEIISTLNTIVNFITLALASFSGIALLAAAFGIINTQLMSVFERTKEIGLLKALGMSNKSVQQLFSYEATLIGLIGAGLGAGLAVITQIVVNSVFADNLKDFGGSAITIAPEDVVIVMVGLSLLAWLAGVIPARKAQQLDPIAALREE